MPHLSSLEEPGRIILALQESFSEDLLKPRYRGHGGHPSTGHCYAASEALYHLWGKQAGAKPVRMPVGGDTHWWLVHPELGVLDPTAEQFPFSVAYEQGKGGGFLTREPSKRARILMARAQARLTLTP